MSAVFMPAFAQDKSSKLFCEMSSKEIEKVIIQYSNRNIKPTDRINELSKYFLGTPYNLQCTGDGHFAIYEPWPLVNFKETNCMALCEHVLALSISDSWDNFFNNLQHIRYRDGLIGIKTRNHYTMADWLPKNSWLLDDVSEKVGGAYTRQVTRTISHKDFFAAKGVAGIDDILPDRKLTINYVPLEFVHEVKNRIMTGDILVLIIAGEKNIFAAHMLMVAEENGKKVIREASTSKMTTFETDIDEWIKQKQIKYAKKYLGISLIRIKSKLNKPGRNIKSWEMR